MDSLIPALLAMLAMGISLGVLFALCKNKRQLSTIVYVTFSARIGAALIHYYVMPLPGGLADAIKFENLAWEMSHDFWGAVVDFGYSPSHIYALVMAIPYALTDRSPLMLQMFSVLVGTLNIYLVWKLTAEVWGEKYSVSAAWIAAVLPVPIMYSALIMREAYFVFFLLLALLFAARWINEGRRANLIVSGLAFGAGMTMHGAMVIGLAALAFVVFLRETLVLFTRLAKGRVPVFPVIIVLSVTSILVLLFLIDPAIPKLGRPTELLEPDRYLRVLQVRARGDAVYPEWMMPRDVLDLFFVAPWRVIYFLFSPFPWDIRSTFHLIGTVDALIYMLCAAAIAVNFDALRKNPAALVVLVIVAALIIGFSMGTSNFGSAVRHRAKFVAVLVVLAIPVLDQFRRVTLTRTSPQ